MQLPFAFYGGERMNILAIGDVVSAVGCEFLRSKLPAYKKLKAADICIANG